MTMKGKRVLITGGLGFIGSNLAMCCLEQGAEVTVYDCLDPRSGGNMYNIAPIERDVRVVLNDIRSFEGVSAVIRGHDLLFNCAAFTSHPNSMKEPLVDIEVNCMGVINILEAIRRFNPSCRMVQVGTSTQIGRMIHSPVDEIHPEFPVDIYSANKSASEKYVLVYGSAYGMETTVVRLANVYGPRSNIKNPDFGFMNYFIGLGLQGKEITVFGEGRQLRTITFVRDVVDALVAVAGSETSRGQVYFAVADRQYTVNEIATAIVEVIGGTLRYVEWPRDREAIEIGDAVITNRKIREAIDWSPKFELREGLQLTREYFSDKLREYLR
jgi:UDP-glucose 4-epimerase